MSDDAPKDPPRSVPKSVREGLAPTTSKPPEIEMPERILEVDGEEWRVTEVGRAGAGTSGTSRVPLLLLVFRREEEDEGLLEAMAVGGSLSDLSEGALRIALERSRPHRPADQTRPFFEDAHRRDGS